MTSAYEAFSSNPRYSAGGLDYAKDQEELMVAKSKDTEKLSIDKLAALVPQEQAKIEAAPIEEGDKERKVSIETHEKILGALDTVTGPFRDITAGTIKAADNTIALVVGRENADAGNQFLKDNIPGWDEVSGMISRGLEPRGMVSQVTQDMSQFMVPFGLYMKGIGGLAAAGNIQAGLVTKSVIADIVTSGSALDPHMERFAGLMKEIGVDNLVNDWLADTENETDSEGRLKNILDSAAAGGIVTAGFMGMALTLKGLYRTGKAIKNAPMSVASGTRSAQRGSIGLKNEPNIAINSVDDLERKLSALNINSSISESDKSISVSKIIVDQAERNTGKGTDALKSITDYADTKGKIVTLNPSKDFGATSVKRLTDFYKRAGFVENKGRNKDYEISASMYRLPNKAK